MFIRIYFIDNGIAGHNTKQQYTNYWSSMANWSNLPKDVLVLLFSIIDLDSKIV